MKRSNFFLPMRCEKASGEPSKSGEYCERMGMVAKVEAGIYTHLPGAYKLFQNVRATLNSHLLKAGCSEHQFPAIQPTHEVLAALTAKQFIRSYSDMPVRLSQIQTKFGDETQPRDGLMRTREFLRHDLYSFDTGRETAEVSYELIRKAYEQTLLDLRVPFVVKEQDGTGGVKSHVFHVISSAGEEVYVDDGRELKSIEIAHIFMLGDRYTKPYQACYVDRDGGSKEVFMCSFGMGIERTVAAYLEHYLADDRDLLWSWALAPYKVMIIGGQHREALAVYEQLNAAGYEAMIDDRSNVPLNQQLKEGMLMGLPVYVIFGRQFEREGMVEVKSQLLQSSTYVDPDAVLPLVQGLHSEIRDVELARMSFDILRVDRLSRKIYVNLRELSQLDHSFCQKVETGTDLLGNFANRKKLWGSMHLKAGQYWIAPVMQHDSSETQVRSYHEVPYILMPSITDDTLEEMSFATAI